MGKDQDNGGGESRFDGVEFSNLPQSQGNLQVRRRKEGQAVGKLAGTFAPAARPGRNHSETAVRGQ